MQRCLNRRHGEHQGYCTRLLHRTLCTAAEIIKQVNSRTSGWPVNCTRITDIDTIKSHRLHLEEANTEPFRGSLKFRFDWCYWNFCRRASIMASNRDAEAEKHREHLQHHAAHCAYVASRKYKIIHPFPAAVAEKYSHGDLHVQDVGGFKLSGRKGRRSSLQTVKELMSGIAKK